MVFIVATLALGLRPRQRLARVWDKREAREAHFNSQECRRVWENELSHFQVSFHFGSWSPDGLPNLQGAIAGAKTHGIEDFFIPLKSYGNVDV
jgi:hypothetical protein